MSLGHPSLGRLLLLVLRRASVRAGWQAAQAFAFAMARPVDPLAELPELVLRPVASNW